MKRFFPLLILGSAIILSGCQFPFATSPQNSAKETAPQSTFTFENPKKSAHFESNTPAQATTLAGVPVNVVINFNFDLAKSSSMSITQNGKDYGVGETTIDANKLAMRKNVDIIAPDGLYTVSYNACWPDGSCHDGSFQFAIDRKLAEGFVDARIQSTVNISLENISFAPKNVRVSKGSEVVWTNKDSTIHYINTDSHPAHTYYPSQNSKALNQGDTFGLTFDTPGIYLYHCSAHAESMTATILVE